MNFPPKNRGPIKQCLFILATLIVYILAFKAAANTNAVTLNLSPKQCVALHQGKLCYVDIEISWSAQQQGNYCLFSSQQKDALRCWSGQVTGQFNQEVVANKNVQFYLKQRASDSVLQTVELEMKWVYKKNAKPRSYWRVF